MDTNSIDMSHPGRMHLGSDNAFQPSQTLKGYIAAEVYLLRVLPETRTINLHQTVQHIRKYALVTLMTF